MISPLELFSAYPADCLCVSCRLYPTGIPVHALVGIPMQNDGSLLLVGGLGYERNLSEGVSRK